ncbi:N-acetylmuramoyl-L-alanine amidase [Muriicola sp. SD30]|uniref:N-acetylmuramoyl-L-alanine amidase family protein n=1 Tax=Muriicola sp. SD30 TaxID=3240936 RepID=UPI00350EC903
MFCIQMIASNPLPEVRGDEGFVVVLDAGHGGHDPGNLGNGYMEKNIALSIVLKIGEELKKVPGIKVVYTRDDDSFVDLFVRGEIANKAGADLFVSVHCDSHTSNAHGAGTFVLGLHANKQNFEIAKKENSVIYLEDNYEARYANYDINSPESVIGLTIMQEEFLDQSILLAKLIQDNFTGNLKRNDRKVKQAGFIVLHQTFMPSVLIETGFLTNKEEGKYLNSSKGQAEMGKAIAQAIIKYRSSIPDEETVISNGQPPVASPEVAEIPKKANPDLKQEELLEVNKEVKEAVVEVTEKSSTESAGKNENPEETKENTPKARQLVEKSGVTFKVQIMATARDLPPNSPEFNGLNRISKEPIKNLFRYLYGETDTYMGAKLLKSNADMKGFTTSYIVAYKEGKRIALQDALKYEDE